MFFSKMSESEACGSVEKHRVRFPRVCDMWYESAADEVVFPRPPLPAKMTISGTPRLSKKRSRPRPPLAVTVMSAPPALAS